MSHKLAKKNIALIRPGALGDIIMSLNFVEQLAQHSTIFYFCHKSCHNLLASFVDIARLPITFLPLEQYNQNQFNESINLIGYPLNEGYPHKPMQNHLLEYFAKEMNCSFTFNGFVLDLPKLPKKIKNQNSPRYITFQVKTGWSVYKEWWGWQELINLLKNKHPEIEIYQIGGPRDPQVSNTDGTFCGDSFEDNIHAQAWACLHLGLDSVFNHTTNIQWRNKGRTPAIILFGSTQANASGYPHNKNISLNLPCQPCFREDPKLSKTSLGPCINPSQQTYENPKHACMSKITVDMVYAQIKNYL